MSCFSHVNLIHDSRFLGDGKTEYSDDVLEVTGVQQTLPSVHKILTRHCFSDSVNSLEEELMKERFNKSPAG